jgi:hypothetical protein
LRELQYIMLLMQVIIETSSRHKLCKQEHHPYRGFNETENRQTNKYRPNYIWIWLNYKNEVMYAKGTKMKMDILYPMLDINTSISTIFNFSRLPQREIGTEANALDINLMKWQ